jgi:hypothetical protein
MRWVNLIVLTVWAVFTFSSFADAQVPELLPIPTTLSQQQQEGLLKRRTQLESQWYNLVLKVNDHNRKCSKVLANTPLADECRENMKSFQTEIAAYIQSVNSFNQTVRRETSIDRIEVPIPISPEDACAGEIGCLADIRIEKAVSWLKEKSWDARVWKNDPMHGAWVRDAALITLPLMVEAGLSKISSLIPASNAPRHVYLTETEFWNIDPNMRNIIYHIKSFSDGSVRELRWLVNFNIP